MNPGQDKLSWSQSVWDNINRAVLDECKRTKIGAKFLPLHGPVASDKLTVPSDTIQVEDGQPLEVDEADRIPLIEIWVEFTLTQQQVAREEELMTAVTLATRAANTLSQGADLLIYQGQAAINGQRERNPGKTEHALAIKKSQLFESKRVRYRSGPAREGLIGFDFPNDPTTGRVLQVDPDPTSRNYGEKTFKAVSDSYSRLQGNGHYGPYALILPTVPYADTYAPLENTLIMPADRIKPLVMSDQTPQFYGTGTLPTSNIGGKPSVHGVLVSLGGNTMDLVVGKDATTAFMQEDTDGRFRFRVFERFALRLKDKSAVIRLDFILP